MTTDPPISKTVAAKDLLGMAGVSAKLPESHYYRHWAKGVVDPSSKVKPKSEITERICMACQKPFKSEGKHNRLCKGCSRG